MASTRARGTSSAPTLEGGLQRHQPRCCSSRTLLAGCLPGSRRPSEGPAWYHCGGQEYKGVSLLSSDGYTSATPAYARAASCQERQFLERQQPDGTSSLMSRTSSRSLGGRLQSRTAVAGQCQQPQVDGDSSRLGFSSRLGVSNSTPGGSESVARGRQLPNSRCCSSSATSAF